jgi:aminopeptidase N
LYKEGVSTITDKHFVAAVVTHENAHMWFGNEVTPLWWDYLWLSEGFATYFEYYMTDQVSYPTAIHSKFKYAIILLGI